MTCGKKINTQQLTIKEGAQISAENISSESENITLRGLNTLNVLNGGQITASTQTGTAGDLSINKDETPVSSVEISGEDSSLAVEATGNGGEAGKLTINTDRLLLQDGASVTVESEGVAGNLKITADSIKLDNGELTAIAGEGNLGNIDIDLTGTLLQLDNDSLISAGATERGSGGDLTIKAVNGFVLANPLTG